ALRQRGGQTILSVRACHRGQTGLSVLHTATALRLHEWRLAIVDPPLRGNGLAIDSAAVKKKQPETSPKRRHRFLPLAIGTSGGVLLATAAFWFFKKQAEHVVRGRADRYDDIIMETVHRIDNPGMHNVMEAITQLG